MPGARLVQPSIGLDQYQSDPRGAQTPLDYASRDGAPRRRHAIRSALATPSSRSALDYRDKDQRSYFDQGGFPSYRADELKYNSFTPRVRLPFSTGSVRTA